MSQDHYFSREPKTKPHYGLIQAHLHGRFFEFLTASGVFSKKRIDLGTRLLVESMVLPEVGNVLDLGCGYGAVGIVVGALRPRASVYLVDVNERAVRLAKENAKRNGIRNTVFRSGYLYDAVNDLKFDVILSNPPVSAGLKVVVPIIQRAPLHLVSKGAFQMVMRSKIGGKRFFKIMEETFGNVDVLAVESGYRVLLSKKP